MSNSKAIQNTNKSTTTTKRQSESSNEVQSVNTAKNGDLIGSGTPTKGKGLVRTQYKAPRSGTDYIIAT